MKSKFGHLLEKRVAMFGKGGIVEGGVGGERKGDGSLRSRRGGGIKGGAGRPEVTAKSRPTFWKHVFARHAAYPVKEQGRRGC